MTLEPKVSNCIASLCEELASEIDLHHEDHELPATEATMRVLQDGAALLVAEGIAVPDAVQHIFKRFADANRGGVH